MGKKDEKIISGFFWRFSENIAAQIVSFIVSVILARILMPEDFGVVAIVLSFTMIVEILVSNGLGSALIQKKEASNLEFSTIFWCNFALAAVLYLVLYLLAPFLAKFYGISLLKPVLRVFGIKLFLSAFKSIQAAYVSRKMDFKKFFYASLIGTIASAFVGISMAYLGFGVWALVAQYLSDTFIDVIILSFTIGWSPKLEFSVENAKPLIRYGWKISVSTLLATIFNQLNSFIIGKRYSSVDLAYYSQGKKFPDVISYNFNITVSSVLFPAISMGTGIEEIKRIRRNTLKMLFYVLLPVMMGMIVISDKMILVFLTEKWIFAVPYVRISCIAWIVSIIGKTLPQEINAIGRSDITLRLEFIKRPLYLIFVIVAMMISVKAVASTLIIFEIIEFCCNYFPVKKYIGFDIKLYLKDALPSFLMSVIMMIVVICIGKIFSNNLLCLVMQIFGGCIVYIGLSFITKNDSFNYLCDILRQRVQKKINK